MSNECLEEEDIEYQQLTDELVINDPKEECRICGDFEITKRDKLISPCSCSGSISKVHVSCLEKWILNRPGNRAAGDNLECEICHSTYKVALTHRISLNYDMFCSGGTFWHLFEAMFLLISVTCIMLVFYVVIPDMGHQRFSGQNQALLAVVYSLVGILLFVALIRLFTRWYRTSSVPRVTLL